MTNKTNLQQLADQNISLNNQLNKLIILKTSPEKPKKKVTATFVNKSNYVNIISGNGSKVINMPTQKNFNSPLENKIVTLPYAAPYFPDNENINNNSQYENIYNSILNKSNKQNTLLNEKKIKNTFLTQETDFISGTLIRTAQDQEVKVETLSINDKILTYDWENQQEIVCKIKTIHHKKLKNTTHLIRILKNTIAPNIPHQDLLVTPDYCLFLNNRFIPVNKLVNHYNIFYDETVTDNTYYHIELEKYSAIWTNGILTETSFNDEEHHVIHQNYDSTTLFTHPIHIKNNKENTNQSLLTENNIIKILFNKFLIRANKMGIKSKKIQKSNDVSTDDLKLHLMTEMGDIISPHSIKKEHVIFIIPENTKSIYLGEKTNDIHHTPNHISIGEITLLTQQKTIKVHQNPVSSESNGWQEAKNTRYVWFNEYELASSETQFNNQNNHSHNILIVQIA